ncbi:MAG: YaaL family protein [Clostridia bacterium]|nr:YaaL family protein [Clostridia bacterium]
MTADLFADTAKPYAPDPVLAKRLHNVLMEIRAAKSRFNLASDPCETEAIIYRLKSLETEYSYLLRTAKLERINSEVNVT